MAAMNVNSRVMAATTLVEELCNNMPTSACFLLGTWKRFELGMYSRTRNQEPLPINNQSHRAYCSYMSAEKLCKRHQSIMSRITDPPNVTRLCTGSYTCCDVNHLLSLIALGDHHDSL